MCRCILIFLVVVASALFCADEKCSAIKRQCNQHPRGKDACAGSEEKHTALLKACGVYFGCGVATALVKRRVDNVGPPMLNCGTIMLLIVFVSKVATLQLMFIMAISIVADINYSFVLVQCQLCVNLCAHMCECVHCVGVFV